MKTTVLLVSLLFLKMQSFGQKEFAVRIDPRMEAVSIFYTLATVDTLDVKPTPSVYYRDFIQAFKNCKNHPSIKWYAGLEKWDGYDVSSIGLFLSRNYPFHLISTPENNYIRSSPVDTFLSHFNKFYHDCHVEKFIKDHAAQYQEICRKAEDTIAKSKILEAVQQFFGSRPTGQFIIHPDILNNLGNNAILTNGIDIVDRLAYLSDSTTTLTLDSPVSFIPHSNVVAHECSHIYLRNFVKRYEKRLYKIRGHFLTTAKGKHLQEDEWKNEVDELLVRACVAKILESKFGEDAGLVEINNQALRYKWAKGLYLMLNEYTSNRKKYPTFSDFYPEIIQFLETKTFGSDSSTN